MAERRTSLSKAATGDSAETPAADEAVRDAGIEKALDAQDRSMRGAEREDDAYWRNAQWDNDSLLPTPSPRDGFEFRWIRSSLLGQGDTVNMSLRFRQGWKPVAAEDFPEMRVMSDMDTRFPDNIEVGGLLLCMCPTEIRDKRRAKVQEFTEGRVRALDDSIMNVSNPAMPMQRPQRETKVHNFG